MNKEIKQEFKKMKKRAKLAGYETDITKTKKGHFKFRLKKGKCSKIIVTPSTPSDHRWKLNFNSEINKVIDRSLI